MTTPGRSCLMVVGPKEASFVDSDLHLLGRRFDVISIDSRLNRRSLSANVLNTIRFAAGLVRADALYIWFGGYHASFLVPICRLLRKKSLVVVGGYEVRDFPLTKSNLKRRFLVMPFAKADRVLAVEEHLRKKVISMANVSGSTILTIPTGYDYSLFSPKGPKEDIVLTVCLGDFWERAKIKGVDIFVQAALLLPEVKFQVVGLYGSVMDLFRATAPRNVEFIPPVPHSAIMQYMQKAKVYCQLSISEGLPNALCEAMLCGCIPVGTRIAGVERVMGNVGFYVNHDDPKDVAEKILVAMGSDIGGEARTRVACEFPLEAREEKIIRVVSELLSDSRSIRPYDRETTE